MELMMIECCVCEEVFVAKMKLESISVQNAILRIIDMYLMKMLQKKN